MIESLPSDILYQIFTLAITNDSISVANQWSNFSLISSNFTYAAQSRILRNIEVRDRVQLKEMVDSLYNKESRGEELGGMIRSVKIGSTRSIMSTSINPILAVALGSEKGGLDQKEFIELFRGLPQLLQLKLHKLPCYKFNDFSSDSATSTPTATTIPKIPLFPNLQYLNLTSEPQDENQDLLRYIMSNSPYLNQLHLTGAHRGPWSLASPILLSHFPPIKLFTVTGPYYEYLLFSPHQPLLPISFYSKLEHLDVEGKVDWRGFGPILQEVGDTLRSLRLRSVTKAVDLINSLPFLIRLESLQTTTLISLPIDFFQLLPSTLTILKVLITRSSLEHFKLHPREELNLLEMWLPDNDIEAMKFLPSSVRKIVYRQGWPYKVLQFLESNFSRPVSSTALAIYSPHTVGVMGGATKKLENLELEEIVLPKYRALDKEWENDVARFKDFDVRLTTGKVEPREGDII